MLTLSPDMTSIKSLVSFKLDLPPSCIEFFPLNPQYAVIGTYNLQKQGEQEPSDGAHGVQGKSQQRNGSLILVRIVGDNVYVLMMPIDITLEIDRLPICLM